MMIPISDLITIFKKSNRTIAIAHLINLILNLILFFTLALSLFLISQDITLDKELEKSIYDVLGQLPGNYIFNLMVNIVINTIIMILAFINQAKIKNHKLVSDWPYLLGYTLCAINIIFALISGSGLLFILTQLIYLAYYISAHSSGKLLNTLLKTLTKN